MKQAIPLLVLVFLVSSTQTLHAVPGDVNRDGVVNFDDFFILSDNFGKAGQPETQAFYDTVVVEVQQIKTILDTLVIDRATVYDTVTYGREPIRFAPPPPPDQLSKSLVIPRTNYLNIRIFDYLMGDIRNESTTSVEGLSFRLTVRNNEGQVVDTEVFSYGVPDMLIAHDTRPFQLSLSDDIDLDLVRSGNYTLETTWRGTAQQLNNVSVQLDTSSLVLEDPFAISGEVINTSDLQVKSFDVTFYGKDTDGNVIYYEQFFESSFGIPPGGKAPFSIESVALDYEGRYVVRSDLKELYYSITWQWTTSSFLENETTPLTRLF